MPDREVIRCPWCKLNQFMTVSGNCRKPECGKPLKIIVVESSSKGDGWFRDRFINGPFPPEESTKPYYRPETPFNFLPSRVEAVLAKQIVPAFNTSKIVKDILSNVRRGKVLTKINKQPRYRNEGLRINDFPTELRLRAVGYARKNKMTLRDVVIKSIEKMLDGE